MAKGLAFSCKHRRNDHQSGVIRSFLFEVTPNDPGTYFVVVAGLLAVTCLAAYLPARRAAAVNPAPRSGRVTLMGDRERDELAALMIHDCLQETACHLGL